MKGFNFERNLKHQKNAVNNTLAVFKNLPSISPIETNKNFYNPKITYYNNFDYVDNISNIQRQASIFSKAPDKFSNIIDIMMETGTGKTYTYTKTIFELNAKLGIFKFIVVVPTLSIKAGTISFLKSESCQEHFKEEYKKIIEVHTVESKKFKKDNFPFEVENFLKGESNSIHILLINQGMINSETMQSNFDVTLFDKFSVPFEAIAATQPFMIIDEPHKFAQDNKTWQNIQKMSPQIILRYGATFPEKTILEKVPFSNKKEKKQVKDYHHLIYQLSSVEAFNENLVKGVIGHVTAFDEGKNALVKLVDIENNEAILQLTENKTEKTFRLKEKDSLGIIHEFMNDLFLEKISGKQNNKVLLLSNGKELRKSESINPYSYAFSVQELMIQKTIHHHFELERQLLTEKVKIKPITLFFIDNISEYRNENGYIKKTVESCIKAEIEKRIENETNTFYKNYLEKSLVSISSTHGGYFSKDNSEKDETIEKEINEILHDKQEMLSLENPRRFIFSKWTLREGWDNPNVFQICKLRSSGSEISKLQEVGRGLRLPVNEFGNRVKNKDFHLNYFVDFTESDFIQKLANEINQKSGTISIHENYTKLEDKLIKSILLKYNRRFEDEEELLNYLDENQVIKRNNDFKENGFEFIKINFPEIFNGINPDKIKTSTEAKKKISIRTSKYNELKELWEKINEKTLLEYKFKDENHFKELFKEYLKSEDNRFEPLGLYDLVQKIEFNEKNATFDSQTTNFNLDQRFAKTLTYSDFLKELSKSLHINLKTIHEAFVETKIQVNELLNPSAIHIIKQNFENFLLIKSFSNFEIAYKNMQVSIHPTSFTEENGEVKTEISASDIGIYPSYEKVATNYFLDELFYDSELEKENIKETIKEVVVFTKIPKNSIKIPVAGRKTYSPDFAYVVKHADGKQNLHFIIETKNVGNTNDLRKEEQFKIKHAEEFFKGKVKIHFKKQFKNDKIIQLINEICNL